VAASELGMPSNYATSYWFNSLLSRWPAWIEIEELFMFLFTSKSLKREKSI
jgi:hypothetical protein